MLTQGGRSRNREKMKALGPRSVVLAHTILTKALAAAVTSDKIPVSPVDRIPADDRPTHTARKLADRHWSPEEARAFLNATADDRLHPLWALALDSGARRGEVAALRWSDVDLDAGVVSIERNRVVVGGQVVEGSPSRPSRTGGLTSIRAPWRRSGGGRRPRPASAWRPDRRGPAVTTPTCSPTSMASRTGPTA
jgi:integrase